MLYVVGAVYFLGHLSTISCDKWKNFLRYYDYADTGRPT